MFIFQNKYYLGEKHILYKFEFLDLVFGKKTKKVKGDQETAVVDLLFLLLLLHLASLLALVPVALSLYFCAPFFFFFSG